MTTTTEVMARRVRGVPSAVLSRVVSYYAPGVGGVEGAEGDESEFRVLLGEAARAELERRGVVPGGEGECSGNEWEGFAQTREVLDEESAGVGVGGAEEVYMRAEALLHQLFDHLNTVMLVKKLYDFDEYLSEKMYDGVLYETLEGWDVFIAHTIAGYLRAHRGINYDVQDVLLEGSALDWHVDKAEEYVVRLEEDVVKELSDILDAEFDK